MGGDKCTGLKETDDRSDLANEFAGQDAKDAEPFKKALQRELDTYMAERYPPPVYGTMPASEGPAGGSVFSLRSKDGQLDLRIMLSSRRSRPRGFWTGNWASQWRMLFARGQQEPAELAGIIELRTHYAEDG